jgi:uncharacterized protein YrrD
MKFKLGTKVISNKGEHIGDIERVVIDPVTKSVTDVVIEKGVLFKEDRVVPVNLIEMADEDRVTLRLDEDELEELPEFEETNYLYIGDVDREDYPGVEPVPLIPVVPSPYASASPAIPVASPQPLIEEKERHIDPGDVAIKENAPVYDVKGKKLGDVEQILSDPESHRITQFVISEGLLLKEKKNVPISWVSEIDENRVKLAVGSKLVDQLPPNKK